MIIPRVFILAAVIFIVLTGSAFARGGLERITDNVYAYTDVKNAGPKNSFGANAGIIVGQKYVAVVDTLDTASEAKAMIAQIRRITPRPIRYVINTHFHYDHALGNSEFTKLGAIIVAHEIGRKLMVAYGPKLIDAVKRMGMPEEMLVDTKIAPAEMVFSQKAALDLGGTLVELHYIAPGHSPDGILVVVPKEKVAFSGDNLFTGFHAFVGTADMAGWQKNLDFLLAQNLTKIIPGHGPLSTKQDVMDQKAYLTTFDTKATELCAASKDLDGIVKKIRMALPAKAQGDWMIRGSVQRKYFKPQK